MDTISLALALKALKKANISLEGITELQGFIHEVDDLNITEAETGIYKVNRNFYTYNENGTMNVPNISPNSGDVSILVFISKYNKTSLNQVLWDWVVISSANDSIRFGTVTKTTDANTQEMSYSGTSKLTESTFNKVGVGGITNDNKNSITQYPSVKAVVDYVDSVLADIVDENY